MAWVNEEVTNPSFSPQALRSRSLKLEEKEMEDRIENLYKNENRKGEQKDIESQEKEKKKGRKEREM